MKALFHFNSLDQLKLIQSNVKNILVHPVDRVVVLINGPAINLFKESKVQLKYDDPRFLIMACQNSMNSNDITKDMLYEEVKIVASGVYTLAELQIEENFAYIKP